MKREEERRKGGEGVDREEERRGGGGDRGGKEGREWRERRKGGEGMEREEERRGGGGEWEGKGRGVEGRKRGTRTEIQVESKRGYSLKLAKAFLYTCIHTYKHACCAVLSKHAANMAC